MLQIITGLAGPLWDQAARTLKASYDQGQQSLLLVPDQMTLQAERDMLGALESKGFFRLQVLSPSRLATRVFDRLGRGERVMIDERGQAMTLARTIWSLRDELRYYGSSRGRPGFVRKLAEAISEFKAAGLSARDLVQWLDAQQDEHSKLRDLAALYEAYEQSMAGQLADREDRDFEMLRRLEAGRLFAGHDVVVHGFDLLTPPLIRLICVLAGQADSLMVTLVTDREADPDGSAFGPVYRSVSHLQEDLDALGLPWSQRSLPARPQPRPAALEHLRRQLLRLRPMPFEGFPEGLRLYAGKTPHEEVRRVAQLIHDQLSRGDDPRGIAVYYARDSYAALLPGVLRDYGIPHFVADKQPVLAQALVRCLLDALRCIQNAAWRPADVYSYLKSPYSPLTGPEAWQLENYGRAYGIRGRMWTRAFTRGREEERQAAEELRRHAITPVDRMREGLFKARSAAASIQAVLQFLEDIQAEQTVLALDAQLQAQGLLEEAQRERQVWEQLMGLFEQMDQLLGAQRIPLGRFAEWLEAGLSMTTLSAVPPLQHSVQAGALGQLMAREPHSVYILGLNNGVLSVSEDSLLANGERERVAGGLNTRLNLPLPEREAIRQLDWWKAASAASSRLHLSYALSDDQGTALAPLIELIRVKRMFPQLVEEGGVLSALREPLPATPEVALDELAVRLAAGDLDLPWRQAWAWLLSSPDWQAQARAVLAAALGDGLPQPELSLRAARVFRRDDVVSVSRLESYAGCPFRHFVAYGLSPVEREEWALEARDLGTFYHAAMDGFVRLVKDDPSWRGMDREQAQQTMDSVLEDLTRGWEDAPWADTARARHAARSATNICRRMAWALTEGRAVSGFAPWGSEVRFGPGEDLPALEIHLEDGGILRLRGTIDRVDTAVLDDKLTLVRVIDYKSGWNAPSGGDLEAGVQLQLMLYLRTALDLLSGSLPAGAFYQRLADPLVTASEEEQAIRKGQEALRLEGVLLEEPRVIRLMDGAEPPVTLTRLLKNDGQPVEKQRQRLLSAGQLRELMDLAQERTAQLAQEIFKGRIIRSPLVRADGRAECVFCVYQGICRTEKITREPLRRHSRKISMKALAQERLGELEDSAAPADQALQAD